MANQVVLTFAGDAAPLSKSISQVGADAQRMGSDVGSGFDRAGEAADGAEGKAQGFSDTLTGVADIGAGTGEIMKGNLFEGFVTAGQGMADLAGGMAEFLIPALKASKVATVAQTVATNIASGATKAFTVAQNLLKVAFLTSPIGWIVLGIGLLIAAVVLIATKTTWFQTIWKKVWATVKSLASDSWDFIKKIPGWIGSAFGKVAGFILTPYKFAFNGIAKAWNSTIGGLHFTVPSWIPGIGGKGFSVPNLPTFHSGGVVPGVVGTAVPILAMAGERVSGIASSGGGGVTTVAAGDELIRALLQKISDVVAAQGGDPGSLGIRV